MRGFATGSLGAKIAIHNKDEEYARKCLTRLRLVDRPLFYEFRHSRFHVAFGRVRDGMEAARRAVAAEANPPLEVLLQLAYCQYLMHEYEQAERTMNDIDRKYSNLKKDIRIGIRCRILIGQSKYSDALDLAGAIRDKGSRFYKAIRRDALAGILRTSALPDAVRAEYEEEVETLKEELKSEKAEDILLEAFDDIPRRTRES